MFQQDFVQFSTNVLHKTPEGYLTGNVNVTGAGVFRYLGDAGKFVGRLRSVDEVKKATDSINCKPVTLQHPNQPVSLDNIDDLQVGMSSNDASFDGLNNHVTITVTSPKAIKAIENGEVKAISMGYKCNVVDNAGVWQGSKHEQEQKDIVYNHIALVREGRAGDQVKFCVGDSAEAEDILNAKLEPETPKDEAPKTPEAEVKDSEHLNNTKEQSMKTIQLDGVDYQADEKVIERLQAAETDSAEKLGEIQTLLNGIEERDSKIADLEQQLATANDEVDEALIDEAVNAKIAIMDVARAAGIECDASSDVSDLKRQVIAAAFDGIDLESVEDESAVNALFASASKKIAKDAEDEGKHEEHNDGNPAAQFDAADGKGRGVQSNDSLEDLVYKQTYELSNGIKKEA